MHFLYDDIIHTLQLQNTIDWCIKAAQIYALCWNACVYQIQWNNAMQRPLRRLRSFRVNDFGTNRKLIHDFLLVINTIICLLSCTVSNLWLIIGQIFASERGVPHFHALSGVILCQYRHKWYIFKTRFFVLHFRCIKYWCIFNHFLRNPPRKLPISVKLRCG